MAIGHFGSKEYVDNASKKNEKLSSSVFPIETSKEILVVKEVNNELMLKNIIEDLQYQLNQKTVIIKEIPIEVIREVKVIEERIVEKEIQVIKEFPVVREKIIKEFIDRPIETIKEIEKEIIKTITITPKWVYGVMIVEALIIILLLLK